MSGLPTHLVPPGGLAVWDEPDGNRQPVHQLAAGLAVTVAEHRGPWTRVLCDNGFTGWVDGSRLVTPSTRDPGRRRSMVAALVAVAAVVAVGIGVALGAGGSDDDPGGSSANGDDVEAGGAPDEDAAAGAALSPVTAILNPPAGWTLSEDGDVVAEQAADLDADTPSGAVVRAVAGNPDVDVIAATEAALGALDAGEPYQYTQPAPLTVSGYDGVNVSVLTGGGRVQSYIVVHPPGAETALFIVDVPDDRLGELSTTLVEILEVRVG